MKFIALLSFFYFITSNIFADEIKKIKDVEIDTMGYLSTDDIETKYDPTKEAKGHIISKPIQHMEAGFSNTNGNTRTTSLNAKYTFAHTMKIQKLTPASYTFEASAFLAKDRGEVNAEEYKSFFNIKQPLPKKWLSYLSIGWLKNRFQNFKYKVDLSIGIGKIIYRDKKQILVIKLGPAINYEKYINNKDKSYTSLNEYIEYRKKLLNESKIYLKLGAKENFSNFNSDYEINSLLGITFKIGNKLDFTLEHNLFYDNIPSTGLKNSDTKTIMRIGYEF